MNPHDTALAIARAIVTAGKPALEPVHVYAHDVELMEDGSQQHHVVEIALPAVFVRVTFEGLTGSASVGRGKLEIDVESQSDDDNSATHTAREKAVREILANVAALNAAFTAVGTVQLLGRPALTENDPDVQSRAFKTPITYRIGVREL